LVTYFLHPFTDFFKCANFTAAARAFPDIVSSPLLPRRSFAAAAANSAGENSRAAASAYAASSESAYTGNFACAASELKAVATQTTHRFFELMAQTAEFGAMAKGDTGRLAPGPDFRDMAFPPTQNPLR
jgi:hypothetical protein